MFQVSSSLNPSVQLWHRQVEKVDPDQSEPQNHHVPL